MKLTVGKGYICRMVDGEPIDDIIELEGTKKEMVSTAKNLKKEGKIDRAEITTFDRTETEDKNFDTIII